MGVNTDAQAVPFQPPPPQPGITPSGIGVGANNSIRGVANKARQDVSNNQQRFLSLMRGDATPTQTPEQQQQQQQQMYVQAAAKLDDHAELIDRFVDWVLFD